MTVYPSCPHSTGPHPPHGGQETSCSYISAFLRVYSVFLWKAVYFFLTQQPPMYPALTWKGSEDLAVLPQLPALHLCLA